MNVHAQSLTKFLAKQGTNLPLKQFGGSSGSTVFQVGSNIYRVGLQEEITETIESYNRFKRNLTHYSSLFPAFTVVLTGEPSIAEIEYVGVSLENKILEIGDNPEGIQLVSGWNKQTLKLIRLLYEESKLIQNNTEQNKLLTNELLAALQTNFARANLADVGEKRLLLLADELAFNSKDAIPSLAHKDLTTGNILISEEGQVRFIDPRRTIPYADALRSPALGNVVVDIVGYKVSLLRKELELQKHYPSVSFKEIIEDIEEEITQYLNDNVFTRTMLNATYMLWYSVYAACRCDYCLAPERQWLYKSMTERLLSFF